MVPFIVEQQDFSGDSIESTLDLRAKNAPAVELIGIAGNTGAMRRYHFLGDVLGRGEANGKRGAFFSKAL